jgi:recombination protein RecT
MTSSITPLVAMQGTLEKMADKFNEALPPHIDVNKFISVAKLALNKNPKLLDLDRNSLMQTFMKAAQDGLLLDGREAAAVPYKSQVNYLPMVDGIIKLMHNSGLIKTISVDVAYTNDCFEYEKGSNAHVKHMPLLSGDRGERLAVWCYVKTVNDGEYIEIMDMKSIEDCRRVAKSQNVWNAWYDQMAKKTILKRMAKLLPKSDALSTVLKMDDETNYKEPVNVTPEKQTQPLSRLKEAMGMEQEEVDQAADNVINNYRKEE